MTRALAAGACCALAGSVLMINAQAAAATSCEMLASLVLPGATVTLAQRVDVGAAVFDAQSTRAPRAFCRAAATLKPSADSDIKVEVWMPADAWNGKFQAVGNGAFSGTIPYPAMTAALGRGYATAGTDTGHVGGSAGFALGHPEKVVDFGWRAVHEMTVSAKTIVGAYYGSAPRWSYWNGCSAGGRQGLKEAQRFPSDFDGIIAGSPAIDWTGRATQAARVARVLQASDAARLAPAKAKLLHAAVLKTCDRNDGTEDGLIEDPTRCTFDPGVLQCHAADGPSCLTAPQVETARLLYSPLVNAATMRATGGLQPGSELEWTDLGWSASARATGRDQFRFLVFQDPQWDVDRLDAASGLARADEADAGLINALDPNLKPFFDRGGKLLQYHGWTDPQISPMNSVTYYQRVLDALGGIDAVQHSHRLFMAPGMAHCRGGEGPDTFDMLAALERWVEQNEAPGRIVASHAVGGVVDRTRPLCPFPQVAVYGGSGTPDQAANFICKAP